MQKMLMEKGFIFPTAEIYGGLAGFFDYGPLGAELKRAIRENWWTGWVWGDNDFQIVGMEGSTITHPKTWDASGHLDVFHDPMVECAKCKGRFRTDQLLEKKVRESSCDGLSLKELDALVKKHGVKCPVCGGEVSESRWFNLMFKTEVGAVNTLEAYLRPETAQLIFVNFNRIVKTSRVSLPFGIATIGRVFRNEISPRNFVFRCREFEQMELEFFFNPGEKCASLKKIEDVEVNVIDRKAQEEGGDGQARKMTLKEVVRHKLTTDWHAYWLGNSWQFVTGLGVDPKKLRLRQHMKSELSHYSADTWDLEYHYSFGWKELAGIANRTDYDLKQHAKASGVDLSMPLSEGGKLYPHVIEPSFGVDRLVFALLEDSYHEENAGTEGRQVMKFRPGLAPIQVGVFPLVNKDGLPEKAKKIVSLLKAGFRVFYDASGSVGRRYRRQDAVGTPFCVTVDGQTLEDGTVTVRERDSMKQDRVKVEDLEVWLRRRVFKA